jgi:hypothetical protein
MFFHRHKWSPINETRQKCIKCGKTIPIKCAHKWEDADKIEAHNRYGGVVAIYVCQKCVLCGIRRTVRLVP